jgi:isoleucyl-tRNA synthetase
LGDFVTEDGTGIHTSPTFGADAKVAKEATQSADVGFDEMELQFRW